MPEGRELQEKDREMPDSAWERAGPQEGCVPSMGGAGMADPKQVSHTSPCSRLGASYQEETVSELLAGAK